jgi:lysophospholipase L1-like esterase
MTARTITMSRANDPLLGFGLAAFAAVVALTCHPGARLEAAKVAAAPEAKPKRPAPAASPAPGPAVANPPARPAAPALPPAPEALRLPRFYAALRGLDQKTQQDHVRILWLGDSHTNADYLTGAVRRRLAERFGSGGPGFVRLGTNPYRHSGARVTRVGRWRIEPDPPSRRTPMDDGVFGFFGIRSVPAGDGSRVELRIDKGRLQGNVRYELLADLPAGSSFQVHVGTRRLDFSEKSALARVPGSPIARLRFESPPGELIDVGGGIGTPRIIGVIAEGEKAGVVLDTVGIDGARFATPLAWNAEVFAAEVQARRPELFVIAYGTNEAFDGGSTGAYGGQIDELLTRLRRGNPNADCLIVGLPDAAAPDGSSLPRVIEVEAIERVAAARRGCAFFPLRGVMGGEGGFARWMNAQPSLARPDRIHLSVDGYVKLGEALADALLLAYERG